MDLIPTKFASSVLLLLALSACSSSESDQNNERELLPPTQSDDGSSQQPSSDNSDQNDQSSDEQPTEEPQLPLKEQAAAKLTELEQLMAEAKAAQFDVTREESIVWFANEFLKYADWDEANPAEAEKFFQHYYPFRNEKVEYAQKLPEFERQQVVNILARGISNLTAVLDGSVTRRPVNKVNWENITVEQDQFVSNGKPIFLYDYFSKSMGNPTSDERLYNDHLGNVDHLPSINPHWMKNQEEFVPWRLNNFKSHPNTKVGYALFWNRGLPKWMSEQDPNLSVGRSLFTEFDIDNPMMIDVWGKIAQETAELTKDHKSIQMGIILSNEPHWFSEQGHWTQNYGEMLSISEHTLAKFKRWLQGKYANNIDELNRNWGQQFNDFTTVQFTIPIDPNLRGEPIWYDWCRFNMDRAIEWFTYLQNEIHSVNPNADTSIKIMPDLFTENNRSHGIDLEALTELTTMIGDDAKIRGRDLRSTQPEHWESHYAYFWEELAVSYDFMESVSPSKIHVNSETHLLSSSWWRDLETSPKYVRNSFWLATLLGMDAGLSWFWARDPDGSPENRLEGELNFFDPALAGSYAASVGMQPQVANELTQVMMDLNSFSEEIMALRQQRRPIRLFYSETSAINKTQHMTDQFKLYESLFFEGFPLGYATEKIIRKQDNNQWDMILVYKTEYVTDDEFNALQTYLDNGGSIVLDSLKSLAKNEYGQTRQSQLNASNGNLVILGDNASVSDIKQQALSALSTPDIVITESNGLDSNTCVWRVVQTNDESYLINIVNLGKNTSELTLNLSGHDNVEVVDLMTGQALGSQFELASNGVLLVKLTTQK